MIQVSNETSVIGNFDNKQQAIEFLAQNPDISRKGLVSTPINPFTASDLAQIQERADDFEAGGGLTVQTGMGGRQIWNPSQNYAKKRQLINQQRAQGSIYQEGVKVDEKGNPVIEETLPKVEAATATNRSQRGRSAASQMSLEEQVEKATDIAANAKSASDAEAIAALVAMPKGALQQALDMPQSKGGANKTELATQLISQFID